MNIAILAVSTASLLVSLTTLGGAIYAVRKAKKTKVEVEIVANDMIDSVQDLIERLRP